ncbi:MAG: class I SAM-dependent methyltransferase [Simkaniaceae bacterium]|nr:class I SAM-dependent methyltransferase [Simkaniaceae bacterium]
MKKILVFLAVTSLSFTLHAEDLPAVCGYTTEKGSQVYTEAFDRAIEFVKMNQIEGDIVEFGTLEGFTATIFAKLMKKYQYNHSLHLFDSFEGFPEITSSVDLNSYEVSDYKVWNSGGMALDPGVPTLIRKRLEKIIPKEAIHIHKGFFSETFQKQTLKNKPAILHIDSDLYQSAKEVLSKMFQYNLVQDGMIILFDDYNCGRANPKFGERRALKEVMDENPDYSFSLFYYYGWNGAAVILHQEEKK